MDVSQMSQAQRVARLQPAERRKVLRGIDPADLEFDWPFWARPKQLPPAWDWQVWLMLMGRGYGKTRSGAEWVRQLARTYPKCRIALVAETAADARDVMVEGESGLMAVHPSRAMPLYEPSKRRVTWANGSMATTYSADEPGQLRGPQHHFAWGDELAKWKYEESFTNLKLGLRLGKFPRALFTTTPRPTRLIRELADDRFTALVTGSSFENAGNVADSWFDDIRRRYAGTRLGRQELYAEILDDMPGALWSHALIDKYRVTTHPELKRVVVGVDPAVTSNLSSDETGIVTAGLGVDDHVYVLGDASGQMAVTKWAMATVQQYEKHRGDRVVAEVNNGGDLVEVNVRLAAPNISYRAVHASRSKHSRAEPVAHLYERGTVHHVGCFPELEDEMTSFDPQDTDQPSPNRMDALVWALTDLVIKPEGTARAMVI